jgi:hypothetical protein
LADRTEQEKPPAGTLHMAISNAVVGLLREYTGRGPTKSRTTIRDDDPRQRSATTLFW